jgi:hypothetical protein
VAGGAGKIWGGEETEATAGSSSQSLKQQQQEALAQQVSRLLWSRFFFWRERDPRKKLQVAVPFAFTLAWWKISLLGDHREVRRKNQKAVISISCLCSFIIISFSLIAISY